jgi:hypothetical protein
MQHLLPIQKGITRTGRESAVRGKKKKRKEKKKKKKKGSTPQSRK